ncbi:MAG: AAA family ATPase [Candidatus Helarchaeales archaeon]
MDVQEKASALILLVGIQASGKSTFARRLKEILEESFPGRVSLISSDETRMELTGTYEMVDEKRIWWTIKERVKEELEKERIVILDSTNTYRMNRQSFTYIARQIGAAVMMIVLVVSLQTALRRNKERNHRQVPEEVIKRYFDEFEPPDFEEHADILVYIDAEKPIDEMLSELLNLFALQGKISRR